MKKMLLSCLMLLGIANIMTAQLDEEIGFKYVKAEYMLGTERFDDAIMQLNEVIKENPIYKKALILRAETKYRLAAYKGAKLDAMKSIELQGVTVEATELLGKAEYALDNMDAALNSLTAAAALNSQDAKVYEYRSELLMEAGQMIQGCEDLYKAADLGSTQASIEARKLCADRKPVKKEKPKVEDKKPKMEQSTDVVAANTGTESEVLDSMAVDSTGSATQVGETASSDGETTDEKQVVEEKDDNIPEEDDSKNTIVIDEELTLEIFGQGLGKRKVLEKPSILMLSVSDGVVAVEICVNEAGRVETAEFDGARSNVSQSSLVSLAIRKSKEFWFAKSKYPRTCGYIYFNVKAG